MATSNLRATFNENAEAYERFRPRYPKELFDDLVSQTGILPGVPLLEIGPGTGQATRDLAARGFKITAVELGKHLADKAREVLRDFKNVTIITGNFEDVELPGNYQLIYSATAFHWIRDNVQFTKPASLLRDNGYLAIIHTEHVSDEAGDAFFVACHPIYQKYEKSDNKPYLPKIAELAPRIFDDHLFELVSFKPYPLSITYTADDFAGLVGTYSPTLALPSHKREELLADLKALINERFDGRVTRHFAMTLTLLRKR